MSLKTKDSIMSLRPYQQGKSDLADVSDPIKLSSNESSFGPSPKAIDAYRELASELHRYPDGGQTELRQAIADVYNLPPQQIICGNGSEELIQLLIRAFTNEGDEVLLSENGFVMCQIHSIAQGNEVVFAPEKDYRIDVDALLARVTDNTRAVIIANPNNPTGTYLPESDINRLHEGLPGDVLLLLDSAYAEYVDRDDYDAGTKLVAQFDNVVMTRTFSKAYGLSGLRIGWAYCPLSVIDVLQRIRTPFNTNVAALAAATAAVLDTGFVDHVCNEAQKWQRKFQQALPAMGIEIIDSVTNFYLLKFPQNSNKSGQGASDFLHAQGIIPRPVTVNEEDCLRVTIGNDEENEAVLVALQKYMAS